MSMSRLQHRQHFGRQNCMTSLAESIVELRQDFHSNSRSLKPESGLGRSNAADCSARSAISPHASGYHRSCQIGGVVDFHAFKEDATAFWSARAMLGFVLSMGGELSSLARRQHSCPHLTNIVQDIGGAKRGYKWARTVPTDCGRVRAGVRPKPHENTNTFLPWPKNAPFYGQFPSLTRGRYSPYRIADGAVL